MHDGSSGPGMPVGETLDGVTYMRLGLCRIVWLAMLGLLAVWTSDLLAQTAAPDPHAAQPERPTVATHAGTVAPGWLEIEAGIEVDQFDHASRGGVAPVLLKVGLAPRLQLGVQGAIVRPPGGDSTGFGGLSVGVKWRLAESAPLVGDVSILPSFKTPSGSADSGAGSGTTDVSLLLISSHSIGPVAMDLNLGYTRRSGDGTLAPRTASVWTVSFGGRAHRALGWVGEIYGYPVTSGPAGAASIIAFLSGPSLQVRPWLVLDGGVVVPIAGPQPRAFYVGVVDNVGRLWK